MRKTKPTGLWCSACARPTFPDCGCTEEARRNAPRMEDVDMAEVRQASLWGNEDTRFIDENGKLRTRGHGRTM